MAEQDNPWRDALTTIDVSAIDALKTLKQEQDVLDQRLAALDEMKKDFAAAVYTRVRDDYSKRLQALDEQSAPLKQNAREQYAKLRELSDKLEADFDAVRLDLQELELRHKLGEFDAAEYQRRIHEVDGSAKEKASAREAAATLKARFLDAFQNETELTLDNDVAAAAALIGLPPARPVASAATQQFTALTSADLSEMKTNEVAAVLSTAPPNKTQVMSAINLAEPDMIAAIGLPPAPPPTPSAPLATTPQAAAAGTTQVFRPARLVPQNPEAGKQAFSLALKPTNLGSDSASDIRLTGPGVDPRHAQIAVSMGGFTIVDLGSKHGTRVNAEKIRERQLRHEDVIQIGAARFVYREG